MSTDPGPRVRQYIAALQLPPAPPITRLVRPRRRFATRLAPIAAGLAVLAVVALTVLRPTGAQVAKPELKPGLPDKLASYSYLTATVSTSPPGTAIALYQHGLNFERFEQAQAVVLGAYSDIYRRIDLAEHDDVEPAPMLLSPDGTRVAVGNLAFGNGLHLVDLSTGRAERLPVRQGRSTQIMPIAWSSDGRYLVASYYADAEGGDAVLYDLSTRAEPQALPEPIWRAAAFSPDASRLAFQTAHGIRVVDLATKQSSVLSEMPLVPRAIHLAWSPDGQLLAVSAQERVVFVDATGSGRPVPKPVPSDVEFVEAWTGPRTLLVSQRGVAEANVDTGELRRLTEFDSSPNDYFKMGPMQFASNLVIGVQSRPADSWPDRGPWPVWLRLAAIVAAILVTVLVALLIRRYRSRRRRSREPLSPV